MANTGQETEDPNIDQDMVEKLLSLGIATKTQCIDAYQATKDKSDLARMKQHLIATFPATQTDPEPDSRSYTDDIKENLDCNTENESFDADDDAKHPESQQLLPIGLLPKYTQRGFITDADQVEKTSPVYGWSLCDATTFNVRRGPNYVSGQKSPSKPAIYEAIAMDTYSVPFKMQNITQFMDMPSLVEQHRYTLNDQFPLPPVLVINIMVPDYSPEFANHTNYDGKGYQVIIYAKLTDEVKTLLTAHAEADEAQSQKVAISPSLRLLSRFVQESHVNTDTRDRFKCMGRVMNLKYTGFNWCTKKLIQEYNAKPFLVKCSAATRHVRGEYLSVDLDAHQFGYVAKKAWYHIKDIMENVVYDLAFVIQGEANEELPERILTTVRISKVAAQKQKPMPQRFVEQYTRMKAMAAACEKEAQLQ